MSKRILLVDDERSIRDSLNKILGAEHYQVLLAGDGLEAIEKHGAERIDLLILDLNIPVQDGRDALEWLVETNPLVPIVIITGRPNQRALAESAGASALMEKPLDIPLLLRTICQLLNEPTESRTLRARNRAPGLRYVPRENELFCDMLLKRFDTGKPVAATPPTG